MDKKENCILKGWQEFVKNYKFSGLTDKEKVLFKRLELWREENKFTKFVIGMEVLIDI